MQKSPPEIQRQIEAIMVRGLKGWLVACKRFTTERVSDVFSEVGRTGGLQGEDISVTLQAIHRGL